MDCKGNVERRVECFIGFAKQQEVTPQHVRRVYQKYGSVALYKLNRKICLRGCGRPLSSISETPKSGANEQNLQRKH